MAVYRDKWNGYTGNSWRVACLHKLEGRTCQARETRVLNQEGGVGL